MLIHAGAGGVGSFGVQLAKARGAHVITTAGPRNVDFVKQVLFGLSPVSIRVTSCVDLPYLLSAQARRCENLASFHGACLGTRPSMLALVTSARLSAGNFHDHMSNGFQQCTTKVCQRQHAQCMVVMCPGSHPILASDKPERRDLCRSWGLMRPLTTPPQTLRMC